MAHSARNEEDKKEYFDSPEELDAKASHMVDMIRGCKHFIVFTVSWNLTVKVVLSIYHIYRALGSALLQEVSLFNIRCESEY